MCGIAGFIDSSHAGDATWVEQTSRAMADSLIHRGPDDNGVWVDSEAGLGLGFRRLAIIDLSPTGQQPMISSCERFVIVYNGEIYNADELRQELNHIQIRGHSDTEVVLEACATWGVEVTVKRLNGMFAFAIWDRQERSLSLVRDRLGIKPLYWGKFNNLLLFGSELKALKKHPGWRPAIAQHLQTDHTELYVGADKAREMIPALPTLYDEPFADSSQIPTYLVSQMTRQHVSVALSGDGGDELYAGYNRYQTAELLRRWTRLLKGPLRKGVIAMLTSFSPAAWNKLLRSFSKRCPGHKLYDFVTILNANPTHIYRELISE